MIKSEQKGADFALDPPTGRRKPPPGCKMSPFAAGRVLPICPGPGSKTKTDKLS